MKKKALYAALVGFAVVIIATIALSYAGGTPAQHISRLSPSEFSARATQPGMTVIDVRTPDEFASGHIDGAVNIDLNAPDFRSRLASMDKDAPYSIYCRSGSRSEQALSIMKDLGFTDVADLMGGYSALR